MLAVPTSLARAAAAALARTSSLAGINQAILHPTMDLGIIFVVFAGGLFWAFAAGRRKVISSIMTTYVALALWPALLLANVAGSIGLGNGSLAKIITFLALVILLYLLLGTRRRRGFALPGAWWQTVALSFLQIGLLVHIAATLLAPEETRILSPLARRVFADPAVHIWWLLGPLLFLIAIRRLAMHED